MSVGQAAGTHCARSESCVGTTTQRGSCHLGMLALWFGSESCREFPPLAFYLDLLVGTREKVAALKKQSKSLDEMVAAKPQPRQTQSGATALAALKTSSETFSRVFDAGQQPPTNRYREALHIGTNQSLGSSSACPALLVNDSLSLPPDFFWPVTSRRTRYPSFSKGQTCWQGEILT